mgnify:CR=1 FL=1
MTPRFGLPMGKSRETILRYSFLWMAFLSMLAFVPRVALAQEEEPPPPSPAYVVQPGDTLSSVAARFGTNVTELQQLNALQDPHHVYIGQTLRLPDAAKTPRTAYSVALGDTLLSLAQRAGLPWEDVARANGLVNPNLLRVGQTLYLPDLLPAGVLTTATPLDTRLALALRYDVPYWMTLRLHPRPLYAGALFLRPGVEPSPLLPHPIVKLTLTPQPVARGQTAVLTLETATPAVCTVTYLEATEPCYAQDDTHLLGFVAVPPLLDPGVYDVALRIQTPADETVLVVSLVVAPGRYDYERLDVPADRQSLLDPTLSQQERVKVAALRRLRSTERMWEFPFRYPLQASVTSYYGSRRSYGYGFGSFHEGTDFRAEIGAPVYAPASGVVVLAEPLVVRGRAILIDHGWGIVTGYWHLSRIDVTVGQKVTPGEIIGAVGNTGFSTGPHLHWELWVNGTAVSPLQWVYGLTEAGLSTDSTAGTDF